MACYLFKQVLSKYKNRPTMQPIAQSITDASSTTEVIAVVLPNGTPASPGELQDFVSTGTMLLVRHSDGRMALEPARHDAAWNKQPVDCVYQSKPIRDPVSREIIGYELEMISPALLS
jgi:hypothetical protein